MVQQLTADDGSDSGEEYSASHYIRPIKMWSEMVLVIPFPLSPHAVHIMYAWPAAKWSAAVKQLTFLCGNVNLPVHVVSCMTERSRPQILYAADNDIMLSTSRRVLRWVLVTDIIIIIIIMEKTEAGLERPLYPRNRCRITNTCYTIL